MDKQARQDLLRDIREEIAQHERELAELRRIDAYLSRKCGDESAAIPPAPASLETPRESVPTPKMPVSSSDSKSSIRETRSWS